MVILFVKLKHHIMAFSYNNKTHNAIITPYFDKLSQDEMLRDETRLFMRYFEKGSVGTDNALDIMLKYLVRSEQIGSVADLCDGLLGTVLRELLGEEYARLFKIYLGLRARCPYTTGPGRRSQRNVNPLLHLDIVKTAIREFAYIRATGFSIKEILNNGRTQEERLALEKEYVTLAGSSWMAALIADGDMVVRDFLTDAMMSENNVNRLTYTMLRAIAYSGDSGLLETEGKLLLAARLQEGLRQSIVETMDEGVPESFIYLFKVIVDNGLIRFSSIKRGIAVTLGVGMDDPAERITDKYVRLIDCFISNPSDAFDSLDTEDAQKLYVALWSIGFYNTEDVVGPALSFVRSGAKHQVQTLLLYLFATQDSDMVNWIAKDSLKRWSHELSVVTGAIPLFIARQNIAWWHGIKDLSLDRYFSSKEEAKSYYDLLAGIYSHMRSKETFYPYVFPWNESELTRDDIVGKMALIALMLDDNDLINDLLLYAADAGSSLRAGIIERLLLHPSDQVQVEFLLKSLADRSTEVRSKAFYVLDNLELSSDQLLMVEDALRLKYGEMRVNAIKLLMKQRGQQLAESVCRLLSDKSAERRLAGLDMLKSLDHDTLGLQGYDLCIQAVKAVKKPGSKEKVLIDSILETAGSDEAAAYSPSNGFGLYDPSLEVSLPQVKSESQLVIGKLRDFICSGAYEDILDALRDLIEENKDKEFKNEHGYVNRVGNSVAKGVYSNIKSGLDTVVYPELWIKFYEERIGSVEILVMLRFVMMSLHANHAEAYYIPQSYTESNSKDFLELTDKMYGGTYYRNIRSSFLDRPYRFQIESVLAALQGEYAVKDDTYMVMSNEMLSARMSYVKPQSCWQLFKKSYWNAREVEYAVPLTNSCYVSFWMQFLQRKSPDSIFERYFAIRYNLYKLTNYLEHPKTDDSVVRILLISDFFRAFSLGLIPEEEVVRELVGRRLSGNSLSTLSGIMCDEPQNRHDEQTDRVHLEGEDIAKIRQIYQRVVDRVLEIELKRGDSMTSATKLAGRLVLVHGAVTFISILKAFGKDTFDRIGYYYGASDRNITKKESLSRLLSRSRPTDNDEVKLLKRLAGEAGITSERLVEAAMYSPDWLPMVEAATGWKGLTEAAYYFIAHTSESCSERVKAMIAKFSPVDAQDFSDGAFDVAWFKNSMKSLGKTRFATVYNAAKYISSGNAHTRARKYADAASGVLKTKDVKREIADKRNKDLLMAYGIIPLKRNADKDLLERYCFIQRFLKESKEFGAQRQESEKKAADIALQNLARNSRYGEVTRLMWSMETALVKELSGFLSPKNVEGVDMWVAISEDGACDIKVVKDGKELKSLPAKLKKHKYVLQLKDVVKNLREQYRRSRIMLEQAMEDQTVFYADEVVSLTTNPVVWPLVHNLVFVAGERTGFFADGSLVDTTGVMHHISSDETLRIAHPVDLYSLGCWADYQKCIFERGIRQPFRQVFRELYIPTLEERDAVQSLRYAGNQIQPQKTLAVLKGRRWIADYESGLQKVYYKENVIATIYALADWFSPADIEAPTLEYVCFYDRKTHKPLKISELPPVLFSEIMRDVDLAVSVAHVGGVDPQTSHSTIEMRRVIIELSMSLFKLGNVSVSGHFIHINGTLANYNIHLGSGVIHREGGAQIAILPVHSQSRGRLFLPFLDEDPKTAEILSKTILLAEDNKIKDPSILNQIC